MKHFVKDNISPVVLFVYNRPEHTRNTLQALSNALYADITTLYIYSDGLKNNCSSDEIDNIKKVRSILKENKWCGEVRIIESENNKGLADSIINGVTEVVNIYGKVIVLEDDLIVSKGFLKYCNEALMLYENDEHVMHISASMYDIETEDSKETFFLKVLSCHGWATWKRAWDKFNRDALDHFTYFQSDPKRLNDFDIDGNAYFMKQLKKNVTGELKSQAVLWYSSWLRNNGISLFPYKSLVFNSGFDGTGENFKKISNYYLAEKVDYIIVTKQDIKENELIRKKVGEFWGEYLNKDINKKEEKNKYKKKIYEKILYVIQKVIRKIIIKILPELKQLLEHPSDISWAAVISNIKTSNIDESVKIYHPVSIKYCIVGKNTYINKNAIISYTEIGRYCSIGPNLVCGWGNHPINGISTSPTFYSNKPANNYKICKESKCEERKKITIGNDVFIGMNVSILDGVKIGDGAVVGAGCVVSKDVPPYAIVVGCPMRILKYRFDEETRKNLLTLKWWDFPDDQIKEVEENFYSVDEYLANVIKNK